MAKDRSLVRASDIGLWAFCHRAWWLAQVKSIAHQNPEVLARGVKMHAEHGTRVRQAQMLQRVGLIILVVATLLLLAAAITQLLA